MNAPYFVDRKLAVLVSFVDIDLCSEELHLRFTVHPTACNPNRYLSAEYSVGQIHLHFMFSVWRRLVVELAVEHVPKLILLNRDSR